MVIKTQEHTMSYSLILAVIVLAIAIGFIIGSTKHPNRKETVKKSIGIGGLLASIYLISRFLPNVYSLFLGLFPAILRYIESFIKKKVLPIITRPNIIAEIKIL